MKQGILELRIGSPRKKNVFYNGSQVRRSGARSYNLVAGTVWPQRDPVWPRLVLHGTKHYQLRQSQD